MIEGQKIVNVDEGRLIQRVGELRALGYRLVQIGCAGGDAFELNYSFDRDFDLITLRLSLPLVGAGVQSISAIYWNAFIYENEICDLFGINVRDMAIDYKGTLYRTKVKWPFGAGAGNANGEEGGGENG